MYAWISPGSAVGELPQSVRGYQRQAREVITDQTDYFYKAVWILRSLVIEAGVARTLCVPVPVLVREFLTHHVGTTGV